MSLDELLAEQVGYHRAVAPEYFDHAFWPMVADALEPSGRVLFVDDGVGSQQQGNVRSHA